MVRRIEARGRRAPGWVQKPLACDFVAYAFAPNRRCYLLPVVPLQRAWRDNGESWTQVYGYRRARNPSWISASVAAALCGGVFPLQFF